MEEIKLKPCPFCGGPAEIVDNSRYTLNKKAVQHWLIDHDLTQNELADNLGISHGHFSKLMNGRCSISISNLFSLAEEMQADLRDLVVEVDE